MLTASLLVSALVNLQLFQDGSSYLFELMISGSAVRHGRLAAYLIQAPSILSLEALTFIGMDAFPRLATQRLLFSLNYAVVPLAAILMSWFIIRERNEGLFFWSVLIVLFVNLVNFSWVSELLIAMQLSCPLMLACFVHPQRGLTRILLVSLGSLIFLLHPLSFLLFLAIAIGSFVVGHGREGAVKRAAFVNGGVLFAAAILRGLLSLWLMTDYEKSMVELANMHEYLLITSIENILFLSCAVMIGLNRLLFGHTAPRRGILAFVDVGLAVIGCGLLISRYFVGNWHFPLKTGLALFASMVLILFASIDSRKVPSEAERLHRIRLAFFLCLGFAAVTATKSWIWHTSIKELERTLAATGTECIERSHVDLQWLGRRPDNVIDNWALPSLVLVRQLGDPARYLLAAGDCAAFRRTGEVRVDPWTTLSLEDLSPFTAREKPSR